MVKGLNAGSKTKGEPLHKNHFLFLHGLGVWKKGGGGGVDVRNQQAMQHNDRKFFRVIFYCLFLSIVY